MSTFGNWVGEEVKELKISKKELARIAGLSPTCVIQVISGTVLDPSKTVREKLEAAIFGLSTGAIKYTKVEKGRKRQWPKLESGELPRFLVAGITQSHGWEVIGIYGNYEDACSVAGYYMPLRGASDKYLDAFVWVETSF